MQGNGERVLQRFLGEIEIAEQADQRRQRPARLVTEYFIDLGGCHWFMSIVIPGRAKHEPGIHNHDREYGFRVCASRRIPE